MTEHERADDECIPADSTRGDGPSRARRPRGDLVQRSQHHLGYVFPPADNQETWIHHGHAEAGMAEVDDDRLASLLGVAVGASVMRLSRVTGPIGEAPFQIVTSWAHPRVAKLIGEVGNQTASFDWLPLIERGGHWPIGWVEVQRARLPSRREALRLGIAGGLPVIEIMRRARSGTDMKPVEVTECVIASDRVELVNVLHRHDLARNPWSARPSDGANDNEF